MFATKNNFVKLTILCLLTSIIFVSGIEKNLVHAQEDTLITLTDSLVLTNNEHYELDPTIREKITALQNEVKLLSVQIDELQTTTNDLPGQLDKLNNQNHSSDSLIDLLSSGIDLVNGIIETKSDVLCCVS